MNRYFTFITLIILWSIFALAGIIRVPQDQPTIQAGINAAENGDTVLAAENTYYENIRFLGKAITVASLFILDGDTNHINNTVINGSQPANPDSGSVVYFISGEDTTSVLTGFTVTGGTGTVWIYPGFSLERDGAGIFIYNSGAKIEKNKITENHITVNSDTSALGAGIIAQGDVGDYIVIRDNGISQNSATVTGYHGTCGCTVILGTRTDCMFENNRVTNNACNASFRSMGGGLSIWGDFGYPGPYFIRNNIISGNVLNAPNGWGGGIYVINASPELTNNIISNNVAPSNGGGIAVGYQSIPAETLETVLINNTITNNSTAGSGGGIRVNGTLIRAFVMNTIVWGNSAVSAQQIAVGGGGSIDVAYSDVQSGWPGTGNIDDDPLLEADSLTNTSPCIGKGIHSHDFGGGMVCNCPGEDINGRPRPWPVGSNPDMGAWESKEGLVGIEPQPLAGIPVSYALEQNYPNPFNPATTIEFALPKAGFVTLTIYNVAGEKVTTLVSENLAAGSYEYRWDARGLASGVYFYKLEAGNFIQTKKMLLIR